MKRLVFLSISILLLLAACGSEDDRFVIKGTINNLGGLPLYAVYESPDGVVVDTMRPQDGKIEMKGVAPTRTAVQLYTMGWEPFMRLYLKNGERIELQGDAKELYEIEMKGNSLNRRLWKLICNNHTIFTDARMAGIRRDDNAISTNEYCAVMQRHDSLLVDYIEKNKSDELSGYLLGDYLMRYDNLPQCDTLWQSLHEKARNNTIAAVLEERLATSTFNEENTKLPYLRQLNSSDTITFVNPRNSKATLLCIWAVENRNAREHYLSLRDYAMQYEPEELQVVALSFDRDTTDWHIAIDNDTARVINLWGSGLYTSQLMSKYNITRFPVYMLGDNDGKIVVRTSRLPDSDVDAQLDSLLNIDEYELQTPVFKP